MTSVAEDTPATQDVVPSPEQPTDIQEHGLSLRLERFLRPVDYHAELKTTQERLEAIAKEERTGADAERVGLEELEKSTKAVIEAHEAVSKKKDQLSSLDESDSDRPVVQSELDQLIKDAREKEHIWSATKEVCHREYGPIVDNHSEPATELKAQAERDIKSLQDQIANLQKQLELASIKRKQTEEEHRRLADQADGDDDDQEDKVEEEEREEKKEEEGETPSS